MATKKNSNAVKVEKVTPAVAEVQTPVETSHATTLVIQAQPVSPALQIPEAESSMARNEDAYVTILMTEMERALDTTIQEAVETAEAAAKRVRENQEALNKLASALSTEEFETRARRLTSSLREAKFVIKTTVTRGVIDMEKRQIPLFVAVEFNGSGKQTAPDSFDVLEFTDEMVELANQLARDRKIHAEASNVATRTSRERGNLSRHERQFRAQLTMQRLGKTAEGQQELDRVLAEIRAAVQLTVTGIKENRSAAKALTVLS
jgi:arginine utilization protein RocB